MLGLVQFPPLRQGGSQRAVIEGDKIMYYLAFFKRLPCWHVSPLHPGGHIHSPRASHDPPFRHGGSHTATDNVTLTEVEC